jgi:hypothetical protein
MEPMSDTQAKALVVFSAAFTQDGWDAFDHYGEVLKIEHTFEPGDLPGDMDDVLMDGVPDGLEPPLRATAHFRVWMVVREPTEAEFRAAQDGFHQEERECANTIEERYHLWGRKERQRVESGPAPEDIHIDVRFADEVAGRVPKAMVYSRDAETGPSYFGEALIFTSSSDYHSGDSAAIIEAGNWATLSDGEMPTFEVMHPDTGVMYEIHYWPTGVEVSET